MALRIGIGKFRLRGFSFPKFGVRGSLFAAFAVIAGMAIVISAGAGLVLGHLGGAMVDLSGRDIPRLAASLQLSAQSASLASQRRRFIGESVRLAGDACPLCYPSSVSDHSTRCSASREKSRTRW